MAAFAPTVLRLAAGLIFVAHGGQKLFGFGGGGGLTGTAAFFEQLGLSPAFVLAMTIGVAELGGGILLLAGLFTRIAASVLAVEMFVAVWKVHLANGFFLNWTSAAGVGHGYEFNLALIAVLVALILTGPGAFSIDYSKAQEAEIDAAGRARLRSGTV
jgi:putative oxidoreductase